MDAVIKFWPVYEQDGSLDHSGVCLHADFMNLFEPQESCCLRQVN
jgi:hypothetical protein